MNKKCIDIERLRRLEASIGFLRNYTTPIDEDHHIGPDIKTEDVELTKLFKELGNLNIRRNEIIEKLMNDTSKQ